jgi:Fe-Mn family superoxide dismutase
MMPPPTVSRRSAIKTLGGAALVGLGGLRVVAATNSASSAATGQPFELPKLGYAYDALEPHIDARTMEIHHSKHHQAYITNANKALADHPQLRTLSAEQILKTLGTLPETVRATLRNNVGGHVNHTFFWRVLSPRAGGAPTGALARAINETFGSLDAFKAQFTDAAMKRFGSGWAWLVSKPGGGLSITSTANQDSPLSEGTLPLLGVDVWEHAYYLRYQNMRADYLKAFWNVVNWSEVEANRAAAQKV